MSSSSTVQNIHSLPFDELVFNNADVIILATCVIRIYGNWKLCWVIELRGVPFYAVTPIVEESPICGECSVMTENLASNMELVNLGKDSLIASSMNGTLNIHNTKTSLTSTENHLNQQKYVCGEFNVFKLINGLTEQL
ncbi:hypothetical protein RclHR1_01610014 [Rhizophagus clarus]|uniref:Uncharacterized protein n=1 Tax=Rhizophagus clarus TaxID=94130 RepID=A0A2Z6QGW6_9GLOM|nr:hypothetical protein RclHR1_01610014 [Rhizophagus clarus]